MDTDRNNIKPIAKRVKELGSSLRVLSFAGSANKMLYYDCQCTLCGALFRAKKASLISGTTKCCPVCAKGGDLTGENFNGFLALRRNQSRDKNGHITWDCKCINCGDIIAVPVSSLRKGEFPECKKCHPTIPLSEVKLDDDFVSQMRH